MADKSTQRTKIVAQDDGKQKPTKAPEPTVQAAGNEVAQADARPDQETATPTLDGVDGGGKTDGPAPPGSPSAPNAPAAPNDNADPAPNAAVDKAAADKAAADKAAADKVAADKVVADRLVQERAAKEAALAKAEQEKLAKARAEALQLATDKKAARRMFAELDDAVGIGWLNAADKGATMRLLAGKTPQQMKEIRAYYNARTGRKLEADVWDQWPNKDGNTMMANVLTGMELRDKVEYYDSGKSMQNLLKHATPKDLEALAGDRSVLSTLKGKMSADAYMKARIKLFPNEAKLAVRERIKACDNIFDDDEGSAMTAFATLSLTDRQALLKRYPNMTNFMDSGEKRRFREIAGSETSALSARMVQATAGMGTDDDARKDIARDAGRLHAEEKALRRQLEEGKVPAAEKADIQKRLKELGNVSSLLTPKRNMDGSLRDNTFLGRLNNDVKDAEMHAHMREMGIPEREVAKQVVMDAIGIFNDDEKAIREAFAKVPVKDRMALYLDDDVNRVLNTHLNARELAEVQSFRDNNVLAMSTKRIEEGNGFFAQDEAHILKSVMDMNAADREKFGKTSLAAKTRAAMDPKERAAFDEAMASGAISLETGMAAASGYHLDGTNQDLMKLVSSTKSTAETLEIRQGYVLSRDGATPTTDAEKAALAKFKRIETLYSRELGTDAKQEELDNLVAHVAPSEDAYTGPTDPDKKPDPTRKRTPTSAEVERSTESGRMVASKLTNLRGDEKMTDDGVGGGGIASWFSDTEETAIQSHQMQKSAHVQAIADGVVSESELTDHVAKGETFKKDHKAMIDAQNTVTDIAATGTAIVAGVVVAVASGGTAVPFLTAAIAQYGTIATTAAVLAATSLGTKELFGGDRYDATGADGARDIAISAMDAVTANATGKLGDLVQAKLAMKFPTVFAASTEALTGQALRAAPVQTLKRQLPGLAAKNITDSVTGSAVGSVRDNAMDSKFWEQSVGGMLQELGGDAVGSVKDGMRDALIGTLTDGATTLWTSRRLNGFMENLEANGMARAEVDGMSFGTIDTLGRAQKALDAGNNAGAAQMIAGLDMPDADKARMLEALKQPDASIEAKVDKAVEAPKSNHADEITWDESDLTPEIQAALDPNKSKVEAPMPAKANNAHADHPELTHEQRIANAHQRILAGIDKGADDSMMQWLVDNSNDLEKMESVLDTHLIESPEHHAFHGPLREVGIPGLHIDNLEGDGLTRLGWANEAMAEGQVDIAIDMLGESGLSGVQQRQAMAKFTEHHMGAHLLEGTPDLKTLAQMADVQTSSFRATPEMLENAMEFMGSDPGTKNVLNQSLGMLQDDTLTALETAAAWATEMRSKLPAEHPALKLHDAELLGQLAYTSSYYKTMNPAIRDLDIEVLQKIMPVVQASTSALNGLPDANVPVRRRLGSLPDGLADKLTPGQVFGDAAFASASQESDLTQFGSRYIIDIENSTGADIDDISAYGKYFGGGAGESEILGHPGQRIEILSAIEDEQGRNWIKARERRLSGE